jgi:hypothetical protein
MDWKIPDSVPTTQPGEKRPISDVDSATTMSSNGNKVGVRVFAFMSHESLIAQCNVEAEVGPGGLCIEDIGPWSYPK